MDSVFGGSDHEEKAAGGVTRGRAAGAALVAAVSWASIVALAATAVTGLPAVPAYAGGSSSGYQPDGPPKPAPEQKKKTPEEKAKEAAVLGTPLADLPPASDIEPRGVDPEIADLLRHGAEAGSLRSDFTVSPLLANPAGPIEAVAGAPWVVEPKRPPEDIIVVEGETSKFNQAVNMGEWLDHFFNDERLEDEINYTRLRLRGDAFYQDGEGIELKPDVDVKLSVPGLERRMVLFLTGDLNDGFSDGEIDEEPLDPEDEEQNVLVGLQTFFNATRRLNVSLRGGARFRDGSPVLFVGPRYRETFNLDPWALRVTGETRWYTDEGLWTRGTLDFDRRFSRDLFFRFTTRGQWSEEEENLKYRARAFLYHRLSNKSVLRYSALGQFDTDTDDSLVNARLRVAWRQKIIRDWLVIELAPEVTFPAERDYDPTWGVLVRLETTFDFHLPWLDKTATWLQ